MIMVKGVHMMLWRSSRKDHTLLPVGSMFLGKWKPRQAGNMDETVHSI